MRNFFLCVFLVCLIIYFPQPSVVFPAEFYQAEVQNISNSDYFQPTLTAINNSKKSITAAMYIIALDPKKEDSYVKKLLDALISSEKRGVSVKVILEYHSLADFTPEGLRYYAYHYLKDNGIDVYFDESANNCLHTKTIVIDDEIVITGSSNWSEAAFTSSYETNLIVRSMPLAQQILVDLEKIPIRKELIKNAENVFCIPSSFCSSDSSTLKKMVKADDERSLDVILILWSKNPSPKLRSPLSGKERMVLCGEIAEKLGLINRMGRIDWRRQIKKTLKKLEERYKLIKYGWKHGKDDITFELAAYPGKSPVNFPNDYFRYDWDRRLSLSGKAVLITMYAELGEAALNVTSLPILYLSKKYGMEVHTYSKGIQELKRFNIIKVQYAKGFKERADTKITILGVYDMDEFNRKINDLKIQFGGEQVDEAVRFADIIYSAYDFSIVKNIVSQMNIYSAESIVYAFSYVKKMRPDNYKRTYNYVLGILKRKGEPRMANDK